MAYLRHNKPQIHPSDRHQDSLGLFCNRQTLISTSASDGPRVQRRAGRQQLNSSVERRLQHVEDIIRLYCQTNASQLVAFIRVRWFLALCTSVVDETRLLHTSATSTPLKSFRGNPFVQPIVPF